MSNINVMTEHISSRGINLRPHLKTCKSIDVARLALKDNLGRLPATNMTGLCRSTVAYAL